jgi:hypothetical protein
MCRQELDKYPDWGHGNIMCNHSAITESNLRLRLFGLVAAKVAVMIKYVDCFID